MISEDDYNNLLESLTLAGIPGMYESIQEGVDTPLEKCEKISWKQYLQSKQLKILKK